MDRTWELPVKLTLDETKLRSEALGKAIQEHADIEAEKDASNKRFKERLESLDLDISRLGRICREGRELRHVPVTDHKDYDRGTVETVRLDTGEVVGSRPMNEDERQAGLFDEEERGTETPEPPATPKKRRSKKNAEPQAEGVAK